MINKTIYILILQIILSCTSELFPAKIFIDLGDVIIKTSKAKSFMSIFSDALKFVFSGFSPLNLREDFEKFLSKHYGQDPVSGLPCVYRWWHEGKISNDDLVVDFKDKIEKSNLPPAKKQLYKKIAEFYGQEKLIELTKISSKAVRTIKQLQDNGHEIFIVSNWDKDSFPDLYNKFKDFFITINPNNLIISGHIGLIKPDKEIFDHIKNKFKLSTSQMQECWFIDDRQENISSASNQGFNTIKHENWHKTKNILKQNKLI
jgi:HAD superfamily hydrolase (TIGR01509 family)